MEDPETASNVKKIVVNSREVTEKLNTTSGQINQVMSEFQQRQILARAQQTIDHADNAAQQLSQASQQVNQVSHKVNETVTEAFGEDQYGENAGANLRQTLANVNQATGNLADDTAALKQEFFFKGFFKKRGYDDLDNLPVAQYRSGELFKSLKEQRNWIAAASLFQADTDDREMLTAEGRAQIDQIVGGLTSPYTSPLIIEGYAEGVAQGSNDGELLARSRARAVLVRSYLELHFHMAPKDMGVVALKGLAPTNAGKTLWDGVCLVQLSSSR